MKLNENFIVGVESSSRGNKAHRIEGARLSQHYSERCRHFEKRFSVFVTVFDVPEQLRIRFKKSMIKGGKGIVGRGFSCLKHLWGSQRITESPLCGLIHQVFEQIRKSVPKDCPHCPPTCF